MCGVFDGPSVEGGTALRCLRVPNVPPCPLQSIAGLRRLSRHAGSGTQNARGRPKHPMAGLRRFSGSGGSACGIRTRRGGNGTGAVRRPKSGVCNRCRRREDARPSVGQAEITRIGQQPPGQCRKRVTRTPRPRRTDRRRQPPDPEATPHHRVHAMPDDPVPQPIRTTQAASETVSA